jgi:hypothetical protein
MATRCINFSKEADEVLPKLAAQHGLNMSEYLSKLVMEADAQCTENLATMREEMERLRRAEAANGKNISALVEMLNTYFKMSMISRIHGQEKPLRLWKQNYVLLFLIVKKNNH